MGTTGNEGTKFLALDIGTKRSGLAISDTMKKIAFPYQVLQNQDKVQLLKSINNIIKLERVERLIIGDPLNVNNKRSTLNEKLHNIIDYLQEHIDITVELFSEKYSTQKAHEDLKSINVNSKKRRTVIDKIAASIILQNYLDKFNRP